MVHVQTEFAIGIACARVSGGRSADLAGVAVPFEYSIPLFLRDPLYGRIAFERFKAILTGFQVMPIFVRAEAHALFITEFPDAPSIRFDLCDLGDLMSSNNFPYVFNKEFSDAANGGISSRHARSVSLYA